MEEVVPPPADSEPEPEPEAAAFLRTSEAPQQGQSYYIVNAAHEKLLDTHGKKVWVWNNDGRAVEVVIAQNTSKYRDNLRWEVVQCPHEKEAVYIFNEGHAAFLDTHGSKVQVWNNHGKDRDEVIRTNTSTHARNLRWKMTPCMREPGAFYVINLGHTAFLDTHGGEVAVWNDGGKDEALIIDTNKSRFARNIRWYFINVRKQDRFGAELGFFGLASTRPENWIAYCGEGGPDLTEQCKQMVRNCLHAAGDNPSPEAVVSAVIRAYTKESFLYREANQALLHDSAVQLCTYGGFVRALRCAILSRVRAGYNVTCGHVWRGMQLDDNSMYQPGQKFLWPNFVSTSQHKEQAFIGNTLFCINLDGEGLTYAIDIEEFSEFPEEKEVLIYPYSGYEVISREERDNGQTLVTMRTYDTCLLDKGAIFPIGSMPPIA